MTVELTLANKMRQLVVARGTDNLPEGFAKALKAFEKATAGYFAAPQTSDVHTLTNTYAVARRAWREATGEVL